MLAAIKRWWSSLYILPPTPEQTQQRIKEISGLGVRNSNPLVHDFSFSVQQKNGVSYEKNKHRHKKVNAPKPKPKNLFIQSYQRYV